MRCPLCLDERARPSWLGRRRYDGREYAWRACARCGTSYYDPMPDIAVLTRIYGTEYLAVNQPAGAPGSPKDHGWVLDVLRATAAGTFVDYGCGAGDLLQKARLAGWDSRGVELNADVAAHVSRTIDLPVTSRPDSWLAGGAPVADVVHVGDVLEHFGDLEAEFARVLALLKPGGLLLLQGPLLSGDCLFNWVFKMAGLRRPDRVTDGAPTHLIASTRAGMEAFVARAGLDTLEFHVSEVAWPGPWHWTAEPRTAALYALRRVSQAASRLAPQRLGNRYRVRARKRA